MYPILFSFIIAIIWGVTPILYRVISKKVSQHFIIFISALVYYFCTMIYIYTFHYDQVMKDFSVDYRYTIGLILTVFVGFFLTNIMYFYALKYTENVNMVTIITSIYPAITLLVAYTLLKEKLSIPAVIGFAFIMIGLLLLIVYQ